MVAWYPGTAAWKVGGEDGLAWGIEMNNRQRTCAAVAVALLLTGCVSPWHAYSGKRLPDAQTALVKQRLVWTYGYTHGFWVRRSTEFDYIWVEDKSGSVVGGKKPSEK